MKETTDLQEIAVKALEETSRTFFIPINQLAPGLRESVTSAYLCMRAIDEIEDHPDLPSHVKVDLLLSISEIFERSFDGSELDALLRPYDSTLPEVTLRLYDWTRLAPSSIAPKILRSTATMAKGMAEWVSKTWNIQTKEDLDQYTYYVAGLVGLLLSDIWMWYDNIQTDPELAVSFGRGLQAVNIIRNRTEDLDRGVDFFPTGWEFEDMFAYARGHLELADTYIEEIEEETILNFCKIPLALAHATLETIEAGATKLGRSDVIEIVEQVTGEYDQR